MTIPDISTLVPRWKFYAAIILGAAALYTANNIYWDQHGYTRARGEDDKAIANAKTVVVRVDTLTIYVPVAPESGTTTAHPVDISTAPEYQVAVDSIKKLKVTVDSLLNPQTTTIETEALGKLEITYWPAWKSFSYVHNPPPTKLQTVTVTTEKLVLEPRSDWETVGYIALGTGVGVLVAILGHIH